MSSRWSVLLVVVFPLLSLVGCSPAFEHVEVSGPVQVQVNVRLSLKSPVALNAPNYWNAVCLLPSGEIQLAQPPQFGFVGSDGKVFSPYVAVRNSLGVEDPLPVVGDLGTVDGDWLCFQSSGLNQILHPPFSEVVILSPKPLSLKSVKWHSSDK